ncbi:hypothetical protein MKZ38_002094 [Zalerion maritima]|uniref:WSC domain-containing protein n=1 Tax=Zalerion maritima TaxID=339359 RepID=A0AAD5RQD1_9PEZI|nr:hypothetical protein MKZ38_002094 [Zalerion maritima]
MFTISYKSVLATTSLLSQAHAFFRMPCGAPVAVERLDPIVSDGGVSGHEHTVMGGNAFNSTMTYEDTQLSTCSTCKVEFDKSNYWVPSLWYVYQNGSVTPVTQVGGATVYYLQRSDDKDPNYDEGLLAFPEGFMMIAGDYSRRTYNESSLEDQAVSYACLGGSGPETGTIPSENCPNGLRSQVFFPSCWDGESHDSDDHKSHMAYPSLMNNGYCPDSHPHRFVSIFYEVMWSIDEWADMWWDGPNGDGHPFVLSTGDTTGNSFHGDFVNGWDVETLQNAVTECTADSGNIEDCPIFDGHYYDDDTINGCKVPKTVSDPDREGVFENLPGCIAVDGGSEATCEDDAVITAPQWGFADMTSEGYAYVGCASDPAGQERTLSDASTSADDMTVETCISFCREGGYVYAGVEYSTQCFCGNSASEDRMPRTDGVMGNCVMKCGGDSSVTCGGPSALDLYEACTTSECKNADLNVLGW